MKNELTNLNPQVFENLVNLLALRVLGAGATGFGPGADGGRDGYFEGSAPYPSSTERWDGVWYIQSKFYSGNANGQKWLIEQVKKEIECFDSDETDRTWPDNWIIASNVDPTGKPETGSFDAIRKILSESKKGKNVRLSIWGGRKVLDLLVANNDVAAHYKHFLTPGHVITKLYSELSLLNESKVTLQEIIRYFIVSQFSDNTYTKLEQAGSSSDTRPAVHDLFIDLPYLQQSVIDSKSYDVAKGDGLLSALTHACAQSHKYSFRRKIPDHYWQWAKSPKRARATLIKGGPGQGKSTIGQYLCQIHRAAFILAEDGPNVSSAIRNTAMSLKQIADNSEYWPISPRIPIQVELKEYAHWHSLRSNGVSKNVLTYLADNVSRKLGGEINAKTIKSCLASQAWIVVFDGLDEVPTDHKDEISQEVLDFVNDLLVEIDSDTLVICTSRPQGYSGQFSNLDGAEVSLDRLTPKIALRCARPLLAFNRSKDEALKFTEILESALDSPNIRELMTTPLQAHIMAVVVRDGGKPPERRWRLFQSFYQVMKRRESMKDYKNHRVAELLRGEDRLLKAVHMRLGFVLHARAEKSSGAQTVLTRAEFHQLVHDTVVDLGPEDIEETVSVVMEATTERLVLVSTPDNGDKVRFDIRQLQEFFAAEFLYDGVSVDELSARIEILGRDPHWREVMHFLLSALIADRRTSEFAVAVQELIKLNDDDSVKENSIYWRRTAPSTHMAARLLLEGVLEDDQKDRRYLKPLISAIGGVSDLDAIEGLSLISQRNSRNWLLNVLMERVSTASPTESYGALFLLGLMDIPETMDMDILVSGFLALPPTLSGHIIHKWENSSLNRTRTLRDKAQYVTLSSEWVLLSLVRILNSSEWLRYDQLTITSMLEILKLNQERFFGICEKLAVGPVSAEYIFKCLFKMPQMESNFSEEFHSNVLCGPIGVNFAKNSWVNGKLPANLVGCTLDQTKSVGGLFALTLSCLMFAVHGTVDKLLSFADKAKEAGSHRLAVLPNTLLNLVPVAAGHMSNDSELKHFSELERSSDLESLKAKWVVEIGHPTGTLQLIENSAGDEADWRNLANILPSLCIRIIFEKKSSPLYLKNFVLVPELKKIIEENPRMLNSFILRWGILEKCAPDLFAKIKTEIKQANVYDMLPSSFSGYGYESFSLQLPNDVALLPILAAALSNDVTEHWNLAPVTQIEEILEIFHLRRTELRQTVMNTLEKKINRAGAAFFFWASIPEKEDEGEWSKINLQAEINLYYEIVDEFSEVWLARSFIGRFLIRMGEDNADALKIVSNFLERDKKGVLRQDLDELLNSWRERSTSPITKNNLLSIWLGCADSIPLYAQ